MFKKIASGFTILAFIAFSTSCLLYRTTAESVQQVAEKGAKTEILAIRTKSGEDIEFRKDTVRIQSGSVVGEILKTMEVDRAEIQNVQRNRKGKIERIVTKDGTDYHVVEEKEKVVVAKAYFTVAVPLSNIQMAQVREPAIASTVVLNGIGFGLLILVALAAHHALHGSLSLGPWH
jgi:hypothetical protein